MPIDGEVFLKSELPEWDLYAPKIEYKHHDSDGKLIDKPVIVYSWILGRKSNWFVINHMVIMGLIASMAFTSFAVDP